MKKISLFVLAIALLPLATLNSCKTEGCTNRDAKNFNGDADKDDGSCTFQGRVVFWFNKEVSDELIDLDVYSLVYYIDGKQVGTSLSSQSTNSSADCGQLGFVTYTQDLGKSKSKKVSYKIEDQDGDVWWDGTLEIKANICLSYELD
jgi:hypothetical protein